MREITYSELAVALTGGGVRKIGVETLTDARARKTGNPFWPIFKKAKFAGTVGENYQNAVRKDSGNQRFEARELPWGTWEVPGKIISHKGERYLRTETRRGNRRLRTARVRYFTGDGQEITREDAKPFLRQSHSMRQEAAGLGEGEQVEVRTFAFSSLVRVRINGETFRVVPDPR